jgi:hypothetical protein
LRAGVAARYDATTRFHFATTPTNRMNIRQPHTDQGTGHRPAGALRCARAMRIRSVASGLTGLPAK